MNSLKESPKIECVVAEGEPSKFFDYIDGLVPDWKEREDNAKFSPCRHCPQVQ